MNQLADIVVDVLVQIFSDQLGEVFVRTVQRAGRAPPALIWLAFGGMLGFLIFGGAAFACFIGKLETTAVWLAYGAFLSALAGTLATVISIVVGGSDRR